ncbi:MAG TPA: DAK2 domain-containing protein [Candidatus Limnocylindrales bacterium]|nr:DAK2 domain-containing protein [Candidatus Limnocylindrales bacterium]
MIDGAWEGREFLAALRHASALLQSRVEEINALNVFPVPDGDTGSNMLATILAALEEADELPLDERTVSRVGAAISFGALMGARGNSGVILSQLFRGIGEAVEGSNTIGGSELAEALTMGSRAAFASVSRPVEGTILTVARDAAEAASELARHRAPLEEVLAGAVAAAHASVAKTPDLLPVLRQAGVVDAGGRGLELLLQGALSSLRGETAPELPVLPLEIVLPLTDALEAEGFGYETVFVVTPEKGRSLNLPEIRNELEKLGVSVLVAGDQRAIKVHVHTEHPDQILAFGLTLGSLSRIQVENIDRQAMVHRDRLESHEAGMGTPAPDKPSSAPFSGAPTPSASPAVVAVAPGAGLARILMTLGATIVDGGPSANPSAGDIADAVRRTGATEVVILPNNPNVRLAAQQAGTLVSHARVTVLPTRNAAEGIAAMLAYDADAGLDSLAREMTASAGRIQTLQVTAAVRDASIGRHKVRRHDYMVLGPDDGLVAVDADRTRAVLAAIKKLQIGFELLTIYRGHEINVLTADALRGAIAGEWPGLEIELVDGGQPHYDLLIAAE